MQNKYFHQNTSSSTARNVNSTTLANLNSNNASNKDKNMSRRIVVSVNKSSNNGTNETIAMYSPKSLSSYYQQQHPHYMPVRSKSPLEALHNVTQMYANLIGPFKKDYLQFNPHAIKENSDIESEFANLTLSIEHEIEKHKTFNEYYGQCYKCGKGVYGRNEGCQAMGNVYHVNCFTCVSCARTLRGKFFYNINNQIYCEEDYLVGYKFN